MKLLCISNKMPGRLDDFFINIKIGEVYNGKEFGSIHYLVIDDSGKECLYMKYNFECVSDTRDKKLKDLGL